MLQRSITARLRPQGRELVLGSLVIALAFALVFAMLWRASQERVQTAFAVEAEQVRNGFDLALEGMFSQMQALATLVAARPQTQAMMAAAAAAVAAEGGGAGGAQAAEVRRALMDSVEPQWRAMQRQFGARQLHFHLVDDGVVTSFLRVHAPNHHGDRLDDLRHIIADVGADGLPRTGFELGRIYAGLRGVVPVVHRTEAGNRRVGVIEAGTAFDVQLDVLDRQFGGGVAVLLQRELVDDAMWEEFIRAAGMPQDENCGCFLEAASRGDMLAWMRSGLIQPLAEGGAEGGAGGGAGNDATEFHKVRFDGGDYNLIRFPLRDYMGTVDPNREPVGSVVVYIDRTEFVAAEGQVFLTQAGVATAGYAVIQGLFLWAWSVRRRRGEVEAALEAERALFASGPVAVVVWRPVGGERGGGQDGGGEITYASSTIVGLTGHPAADLMAGPRRLDSLIHPEDRARVAAEAEAQLATGRESWEQTYRLIRRDGVTVWVFAFTMVERGADGRPERLRAYLVDQTEQQALSQRLEKIAANLPGVIFQFALRPDGSSCFPYASPRLIDIYGIEPQAVRDDATPVFAVLHPDDADGVNASIQASARALGPWRAQYRVCHPQRGVRWVEGHAMPEARADGTVLWHGYISDITHRKEAEAALKESELRFRQLAEAVDIVFWIRTPDQILYVNPVYERVWGRPVEELYANPGSFLDAVHPDDRSGVLAAVVEEMEGHGWFDQEYRIVRPDGSVRWVHAVSRPVLDDAGRIIRSAGTATDITEARQTQEALARSNAELEQFAYVASHDLRQPLRMIASYLTLTQRALGADIPADVQEFMAYASDGAKRMDRLIVDLLDYSRIGRLERPMRPVPLGEAVADACENLRVAIAEAGAEVTVAPDLPVVPGDRGELMRLFQNLIGNAVKYRHPDRPPRIVVTVDGAADGAGEGSRVSEEGGPQSGVVVSVRDNGGGIDEKDFERIFGVFQRLVAPGSVEGTGIGLAVCRKIAEHHGGRIWVESTPGEGSVFRVHFPLAGSAPLAKSA